MSSDYEHERGTLQSNHHPNNDIARRMDQLSMNDQHHVLQEGFSSDDSDSVSTHGCLLFEYLERNQPWGREPLTDKVSLSVCYSLLVAINPFTEKGVD